MFKKKNGVKLRTVLNKIEDNNEQGEKRCWIKQENKVLKGQTPSALWAWIEKMCNLVVMINIRELKVA